MKIFVIVEDSWYEKPTISLLTSDLQKSEKDQKVFTLDFSLKSNSYFFVTTDKISLIKVSIDKLSSGEENLFEKFMGFFAFEF